MTPVNQSKLYHPEGIHNGNCYAASLASLLDLPLWMVPPFEDMFGRFWAKHLVRTEGHEWQGLPDFYIANGPSARGVYHSVIYHRGELVHDPHWQNSGIERVEWCWHIEPSQA